MQENFLKQLVNFGLSEKEARIYLSLLELEIATVFETAKHSGINRSSAYVVLEALKEKGLVGISDEKKVRQYIAASPETLMYSAKAAAKKQDSIKEGVESIVPELKSLHKDTKRKPVVKVFEGDDAVKQVYDLLFSVFSKTKELKTISDPIAIFKKVPNFINHDKERGKKGIKMYAINPATKQLLELGKKVRPQHPYEIALIPEDKFKFSSDMGIYGDEVAFTSPKDNFGIILENKEIVGMLNNIFDLAWEEAKRLDREVKISLRKKK